MRKLKLDVEHLAVESFETSEAAPQLGTVKGQAGGALEPEPLEPDLTTNHPTLYASCYTKCSCGTGACATCGATCGGDTCFSCADTCVTCETCQVTTCRMTWLDNCCV